jgi:nitrogen fixation NifU-like protein
MTEEEDDSLDEMARKLQAAIREQEMATFSEAVLQEYDDPQNVGRMADPDGAGVIKGPCGDTMEIYIKARDGKITEATFMTDGCGATIACGSRLTRMVKGKSVEEAERLTDTALIEVLGGLPEENLHCAKLAVDTLQKALKQYQESK